MLRAANKGVEVGMGLRDGADAHDPRPAARSPDPAPPPGMRWRGRVGTA